MFVKENFLYFIKNKNISLRKVSKDTGVSIKTLSYLINKPSERITLSSVNRLAAYFQISLDEFVNKDMRENVPVTGTKER